MPTMKVQEINTKISKEGIDYDGNNGSPEKQEARLPVAPHVVCNSIAEG